MKPPHLTSTFSVALVGILFIYVFQASGYPSAMFTQQEIDDMEMEQSINDDLDTLGYDREFLMTLAKNLKKAIKEANESRQLFQGGEFQQGNQGGNFGGGGNQGSFNQNQFGEEEEDEEDSTGTTTAGPGAIGILSGLYGIFSGIGSLNPDRILASTVNFFPPSQQATAQNLINQALFKPTPSTRAPVTMRPRTTSPNKNGSDSAETSSGSSLTLKGSDIADIGPGSKPNSNYMVSRTRKTTLSPKSTTPFQDDEFDEESKHRGQGRIKPAK